MLIDALKLLLFPALMAFAASSDLLTMTISNRLSIALAGGLDGTSVVSGKPRWKELVERIADWIVSDAQSDATGSSVR